MGNSSASGANLNTLTVNSGGTLNLGGPKRMRCYAERRSDASRRHDRVRNLEQYDHDHILGRLSHRRHRPQYDTDRDCKYDDPGGHEYFRQHDERAGVDDGE